MTKMMADALPVGPILLGAAKPAHIITPSVTARGIVNLTAVVVAEAQHRDQEPWRAPEPRRKNCREACYGA